jgi:hypothetical protein
MRVRSVMLVASLSAVATASALAAPTSPAASSHRFKATYTGQASGQANGSEASGSTTATGRGKLIGASTLRASGQGLLSGECVDFTGTALLKGRAGAIRLALRGGHACAGTASGASFSGHAKVIRGTATFAGARGKLSFTGTYDVRTRVVTISFSGRISY